MTASGIPRLTTSATAVLEHVRPGNDLIVQSDNGEPITVLDAIEAAAPEPERVSVHQTRPVHDRPYHAGAFGDRLRHVSYFPTPKLREHFERGTVDLVPNDLSSLPGIMRARTRDPLLLLSVSPPDRNGYVSLGTDALYGASLTGDIRVFVEVNRRMPRTSGRNHDDNRHVQFGPADETNDVRAIAVHPKFCAVNATMQVDLLGQCASESLGSHYISSTGGQADFIRGAVYSDGGHSFIVTHATAVNGTISRIQPTLSPGAVVTTHKNLVDKVVTEHGIAELRGRTIRQRALALIAIAGPPFRDGLRAAARDLAYL